MDTRELGERGVEMIPTNKLRFVERVIAAPVKWRSDIAEEKKVRVLQQWWVDPPDELLPHFGEWRDVPLEE